MSMGVKLAPEYLFLDFSVRQMGYGKGMQFLVLYLRVIVSVLNGIC